MTLVPNETEQALNRQYDVYAAAREEYRKKIDEQAARIEQIEAAMRYYACKCKNPHTGCAVEFERSGNARCGWEARAALGEEP